jgi:hypothetical protein
VAATPSIKVIKSLPYRGGTRLFSNRYHFNGGTPADAAHWTTLSDAIVTAEKAIYHSNIHIVETIGYAAGSDVPVFTKTYSTAGTQTYSGSENAGQSAALVRYATTARTPKNHPVYLFNYYHPGWSVGTGDPDSVLAAQSTQLAAYAASWDTAGFSDGTNTYKRAGPNGASATGHTVETYITHRDFPR